jgi:hypothetical protein
MEAARLRLGSDDHKEFVENRAPWYVVHGTPKDAHVFVGDANLRNVLP